MFVLVMKKDRSGQNQTQQRMKKEGINEAKERKGENCKQEIMSKANGGKEHGKKRWREDLGYGKEWLTQKFNGIKITLNMKKVEIWDLFLHN